MVTVLGARSYKAVLQEQQQQVVDEHDSRQEPEDREQQEQQQQRQIVDEQQLVDYGPGAGQEAEEEEEQKDGEGEEHGDGSGVKGGVSGDSEVRKMTAQERMLAFDESRVDLPRGGRYSTGTTRPRVGKGVPDSPETPREEIMRKLHDHAFSCNNNLVGTPNPLRRRSSLPSHPRLRTPRLGKSPPRSPRTNSSVFGESSVKLAQERLPTLHIVVGDELFNIDSKAIVLHKEIARGAFGVVHEGVLDFLDASTLCAIKVQGIPSDEEEQANLLAELTILRSLQDERIVKFLGAAVASTQVMVAMELCEHGSLRVVLETRQLGWPLKCRVAHDIAQGLHFLHSLSIMHRDVKTPNVLVTADWRAKLCDFNFAITDREEDEQEGEGGFKTEYVAGTHEFMAPEVLLDDPKGYGRKGDIFSFGMILIELITGIEPSPAFPTRAPQTFFALEEEEVRGARLPDCPDSLFTCCIQCCESEPDDRTSAEEAKIWIEELFEELSGGCTVDEDCPSIHPPPAGAAGAAGAAGGTAAAAAAAGGGGGGAVNEEMEIRLKATELELERLSEALEEKDQNLEMLREEMGERMTTLEGMFWEQSNQITELEDKLAQVQEEQEQARAAAADEAPAPPP